MSTHIVFKRNRKLRVIFTSVIVRNESLGEKYPGGLAEFIHSHGGECNNQITTVWSMSGWEIEKVMADMLDQGLTHGVDFKFLAGGHYAIDIALHPDRDRDPHPVDFGVDWLKGQYSAGGFWVWYADSKRLEGIHDQFGQPGRQS